jgi:hypothetical protein
MVPITIVNGVYKLSYNWGAPHIYIVGIGGAYYPKELLLEAIPNIPCRDFFLDPGLIEDAEDSDALLATVLCSAYPGNVAMRSKENKRNFKLLVRLNGLVLSYIDLCSRFIAILCIVTIPVCGKLYIYKYIYT